MNDVIGSLFANFEQAGNSVGNVRSLAMLARLMANGSRCEQCKEELHAVIGSCGGFEAHVPCLRETIGLPTVGTISDLF